jgi:hypothetical protein
VDRGGGFACGVVVTMVGSVALDRRAPATGARPTYPFPYPDVVSAQPPSARAETAMRARTIEREGVSFVGMTGFS